MSHSSSHPPVLQVGIAGDIEAETQAILIENGVDQTDFPADVRDLPAVTGYFPQSRLSRATPARICPRARVLLPNAFKTERSRVLNLTFGASFSLCPRPQVLDSLPKVDADGVWRIPDEELANRRDLRKEQIFSIDPPTARDLDDALSWRPLEKGCCEIGVHIADVTYFMQPGTDLDSIAAKRSTTTYLVQRCYPMLPRLLCENLCSLTENEDRLVRQHSTNFLTISDSF